MEALLPPKRRPPIVPVLTALSAALLCAAALALVAGIGQGGGGRGGELLSKRGFPGYPSTPVGFWQQRIGGGHRALSLGEREYYGAYSEKHDPWLKAGKGTYGLWASDYEKKHGEALKIVEKEDKKHALPSPKGVERPPDFDEKDKGDPNDFYAWVANQGGQPDVAFKTLGFQTTGAEYVLALKRLGIKSFEDLLLFDDNKDVPGYHCADDFEPDGEQSGHFLCGQLRQIVADAAKAYRGGKSLWYVDGRPKLTQGSISKKLARVRALTEKHVHDSAGVTSDDARFYCYSRYQEDPEYSLCLHVMKHMEKGAEEERMRRARGGGGGGGGEGGGAWKKLTKGLWGNLDAGGSSDEDRSMMGQSWRQLTAGLWDDKPYKERNGLEY